MKQDEKRGKLIVIDGVDASGKESQSNLLFSAVKRELSVEKISFPDYGSDSSAPLRMYLSGQFGSDPQDVNAYAASLFFAVDRYASFKRSWGERLYTGVSILADRYVSSNMIHQTVKLPRAEWDDFLEWVDDLEYCKLGLPRPDLVLFLDMPVDAVMKLMSLRDQGDMARRDIHEKNIDYLRACSEAANYACDKFGWTRIRCAEDGLARPISHIHAEILRRVKDLYAGIPSDKDYRQA